MRPGWIAAPSGWMCTHDAHGDDEVAALYSDDVEKGACETHAADMGAVERESPREHAIAAAGGAEAFIAALLEAVAMIDASFDHSPTWGGNPCSCGKHRRYREFRTLLANLDT